MMISASITGVVCLIIMAKNSSHHTGMCKKMGNDIDKKLKKSRVAFNIATDHIQNIFEYLKKRYYGIHTASGKPPQSL